MAWGHKARLHAAGSGGEAGTALRFQREKLGRREETVPGPSKDEQSQAHSALL